MKVEQLLEYIRRKKSPEEKAAEAAASAAAPDAWRKQMREEFKKIYKTFDVVSPATKFYGPAASKGANFGGIFVMKDHNALLDIDTKFDLFISEMAKYLVALQKQGYGVYFGHAWKDTEKDLSLTEMIQRIRQMLTREKNTADGNKLFELVWHVWKKQ